MFGDLTLLSRLCLRAGTSLVTNDNNTVVLQSDVDWARLVSLKILQLRGGLEHTARFQLCSLAVLGTLELVHIQTLSKMRRCTSDSAQLAQLAYKLGRERPDVEFIVT